MNKEKMRAVFAYSDLLLQQYKHSINSEKYTVACNTIELFRQWNQCEMFSADDLYSFIYKEDADCIFQYAEYEQDATQDIQTMWALLLCILLAVTRMAYQEEGQLYVPQDIEIIKPTEAAHFLNLLVEKQKTPRELRDYFYKQVCY